MHDPFPFVLHSLFLSQEEGDAVGAEKHLELAIAAWPDNPVYLLAMADCVSGGLQDPERALLW
jgi:hypothetical protein